MTTPLTALETQIAPQHPAPFNPYRAVAGSQLDQIVHEKFFAEEIGARTPPYSASVRDATRLVPALRKKYGKKVVVGQTNSRPPKFFARLETDPSTAVEALAETEPLAICRLAAVLAMR